METESLRSNLTKSISLEFRFRPLHRHIHIRPGQAVSLHSVDEDEGEEELDLTPRSAQQRTDRISSASQYFGIPSSRAAMAISAKCLSNRITAMVIYLIISAINSTTNACVMQLLQAVKKTASARRKRRFIAAWRLRRNAFALFISPPGCAH